MIIIVTLMIIIVTLMIIIVTLITNSITRCHRAVVPAEALYVYVWIQ